MMTAERIIEEPPSMKPAVRVEAAGLTHIGRVRPKNEDAYLVATLQRSMIVHDASPEAARGWVAGEPAGTLLVVADGMGGQGSGEIASQVAVSTIAGYLLNSMPWAAASLTTSPGVRDSAPSIVGLRDELSTALVTGDTTVKQAGMQTGAPRMGTTLTMALIVWPVLYVAHVGDTRCYLWRRGELMRLTTDHTVAQQIAEHSPQPVDPASALHHMLWNSLGGSDQLPIPQLAKLVLQEGDVLMLCSDGLTKHIRDPEIAAVMAMEVPLAARCNLLVSRANDEGGNDNITVVMATDRAD